MKWLTSIFAVLVIAQSAAAEYAMVEPSLGTARLLVGNEGSSQLQNMNAGQLMWLARMNPQAAYLLQQMNMSAFFGGGQQPVFMNGLSSLPSSTSISVSTSESKSSQLDRVASDYNSAVKKRDEVKVVPASASVDSGAVAKSKMEQRYAEALKSCEPEIQKYSNQRLADSAQKVGDSKETILTRGDTIGNWMFLRRRMELVSAKCKSALLASSGNDLYSAQQVENRQGQIQGEKSFTLRAYGSSSRSGSGTKAKSAR